jgi:Uma2 family endonuclease
MAPVKLVRPRVSYADLQRAPEDGRRYELYDGEVFVVPAPIPLHQLVAHRFANLLQGYQGARGGLVFLAPIDIVFSDVDVLQPDVVFFRGGREQLIDLRARASSRGFPLASARCLAQSLQFEAIDATIAS